jgi:hypothetical protein
MKYAVETGSGAMTYIPSFIDWFSHSKVDRGGYTETQIHRHTQRDGMEIAQNYFHFFQNKEVWPLRHQLRHGKQVTQKRRKIIINLLYCEFS